MTPKKFSKATYTQRGNMDWLNSTTSISNTCDNCFTLKPDTKGNTLHWTYLVLADNFCDIYWFLVSEFWLHLVCFNDSGKGTRSRPARRDHSAKFFSTERSRPKWHFPFFSIKLIFSTSHAHSCFSELIKFRDKRVKVASKFWHALRSCNIASPAESMNTRPFPDQGKKMIRRRPWIPRAQPCTWAQNL